MSDTTITAEERAEIRRRFEILRRGHPITGSFSLGVHMDGYLRNYAHGFEVNFIGLLDALEQSEAHADKLKSDIDAGAKDYSALMDRHDAQFVRAEKLREEVNWLAKMCATHCRDKSFDNAQCSIQDCVPFHCYHASAEQWKEAAREAVAAEDEPCQK